MFFRILTALSLFLVSNNSYAGFTARELKSYCQFNEGVFVRHYESNQYACFLVDKQGRQVGAIDRHENFFVPENKEYDWGMVMDFSEMKTTESTASGPEKSRDAAKYDTPEDTITVNGAQDISQKTSPAKEQRTPSSNLGTWSPYTTDSLIESYESDCRPYKRFASNCCQDAESCLKDPVSSEANISSLTVSLAKNYFQLQKTVEVLSLTSESDSLTKHCSSLKNIYALGAAVNTGMGGVCDKGRALCSQKCEELAGRIERELEYVGGRVSSTTVSCASTTGAQAEEKLEACNKLKATAQKVVRSHNYCKYDLKNLRTKNVLSGAMLAGIQSKYAQCENKIKDPTNVSATSAGTKGYRGDCSSAANASHPTCVFCNANPEDEKCVNVTTGTFGGIKAPKHKTKALSYKLPDSGLDDDDSYHQRSLGALSVSEIEVAGPDLIKPKISRWRYNERRRWEAQLF